MSSVQPATDRPLSERVPLSERLRARIVNFASVQTLTCAFVPGGKRFGIGVPSPLYCQDCSGELQWHELAQALEIVVAHERASRLPFDAEVAPAAAIAVSPPSRPLGVEA